MATEQIRVNEDVAAVIAKLAKATNVDKNEAADRLLRMGISRHNALAKYAKSQGGEVKESKPKGKPAKEAPKAKAKAPAKKGKKAA